MPSEKVLAKKQEQVTVLAEEIKAANVGVLVDYVGITVEDDTKLRKELREAGCSYKVIKNRILSRALAEAGVDGLEAHLEGTTAFAYGEDYTAAPKVLSKYAKDLETFKIKAGFIDSGVVEADDINALAKLPSKKVLVAQALGGLNAPIQGFANVLSGTMRALVTALDAIAKQQETA